LAYRLANSALIPSVFSALGSSHLTLSACLCSGAAAVRTAREKVALAALPFSLGCLGDACAVGGSSGSKRRSGLGPNLSGGSSGFTWLELVWSQADFFPQTHSGGTMVLGDVAFRDGQGEVTRCPLPTTGRKEQRPAGATTSRYTSRNRASDASVYGLFSRSLDRLLMERVCERRGWATAEVVRAAPPVHPSGFPLGVCSDSTQKVHFSLTLCWVLFLVKSCPLRAGRGGPLRCQ